MNVTLVVGDLHIGKGVSIGKPGIGTSYNSRISDQKKLLEWISDTAIDRQVNRIILTGDIFEDLKPDYSLVQIFINWLKFFELENIDVHIITGNHDLKRSGSMYTSVLDIVSSCDFEHVFVHKTITTVCTEGVSFTLLPFRDRRSFDGATNSEAISMIEHWLDYEALSIPPDHIKVLIGHLALEGSIYVDEIDDVLNELHCPLRMFNSYHYVWMGHVHRPQVRSRNPHIAHIGSLDLSDFGEFDQQKTLILFSPDLPNKFETIIVPSRPLRILKVSVPEDKDPTDYVVSEINSHNSNLSYKNALVRLEVTINGNNTSNLNRKIVESHLYSVGSFYISNFSESRNISVVPLDKKDIVDNTVDDKSAIKLYSNMLNFTNEQDQNDFVSMCMDVINEVKINLK